MTAAWHPSSTPLFRLQDEPDYTPDDDEDEDDPHDDEDDEDEDEDEDVETWQVSPTPV